MEYRVNTKQLMDMYAFEDDSGRVIKWTEGQLEIIDVIINRGSIDGKARAQVLCPTRYGKSLAVGAGVTARAVTEAEKWAIVAGTKEKAGIIMDYVIMFSVNNPIIATQLAPSTSLERLRMKRSQDRIVYKRKGQVRVFSADATKIGSTSKALMGFGSPNVVEDEAALIPDILQAQVMRMLGDQPDNFLVKIGNPFNRGHFHKTWVSDRYHHVFIDHIRAMEEGRFAPAFIEEMKEEAMFDILYACKFPEEGIMDAQGWLPLLTETEIERAQIPPEVLMGKRRFGVDVAGGGKNYSVIVERGYNATRVIYKKNEPDTMLFSSNVISFANQLVIHDEDIFIDKVGVGKGAYDRVNRVKNKCVGLSGADKANSPHLFKNKRAEMFWRTRQWVLSGGKLIKHDDWKQLTQIKYKVGSISGLIEMQTKEQMLKEGIESPDIADGLAHTFYRAEDDILEQYHVSVELPANIGDPYYSNHDRSREVGLDPYA